MKILWNPLKFHEIPGNAIKNGWNPIKSYKSHEITSINVCKSFHQDTFPNYYNEYKIQVKIDFFTLIVKKIMKNFWGQWVYIEYIFKS